jgi:dolichyl-phosphate beta-glucosyltransferase
MLLLALTTVTVVSFIRWFFDPYFRYSNRKKVKEFSFFENGKAVEVKTPFILEDMAKEALYDITLVVPAYNEELRLPIMMKETIKYLDDQIKAGLFKKAEIIIVDDGSKDSTLEQIKSYT